MASQYVLITLQEMNAVLLARGFRLFDMPYVYERVYCKEVQRGDSIYKVLIYTSIDKSTDKSRTVGSDAIRLVVLNNNDKVIANEKRVNRSENWQYRLNQRIDNWSDGIEWCIQCGNPLVEKTGKYGKFKGCSTYPLCGYTERIKR